MARIGQKAVSILAGNLNSSCSYLITAVTVRVLKQRYLSHKNIFQEAWLSIKELN